MMLHRRLLVVRLAIIAMSCAAMSSIERRHAALAFQAPTPPPGTPAIVSGIVVEGDDRVPVRFARVVLTPVPGYRSGATLHIAISGEDGRFTFDAVPAGTYFLVAGKAGYAPVYFKGTGPTATSRGEPITIAGGQNLVDVELKLIRGGVITGRVVDEFGEPVAGASLNWRRADAPAGDAPYLPFTSSNMDGTDARGMYRLYGLAPGSYIVGVDGGRELRVRLGSTTGPPINYVPSLYPDARSEKDATPIVIGPGELRAGIDLTLRTDVLRRVEGKLIVPAGMDLQGTSVHLEPAPGESGGTGYVAVDTEADGSFRSDHLLPGRYVISAVWDPALQGLPASPAQPKLRAALLVTVGDEDVKGLSLSLQPTMRISGRLVHASETAALDLPRCNVHVVAADPGTMAADDMSGGAPDRSGQFTIAGISAGRYRFVIGCADGTTVGIASTTIAGVKVPDTGFDVQQGVNIERVVLTVQRDR